MEVRIEKKDRPANYRIGSPANSFGWLGPTAVCKVNLSPTESKPTKTALQDSPT